MLTETILPPLPMDGERYIPGMGGEIEMEHLHRYRLAARLVRGLAVLDLASGEGFGSNILAGAAASVVGVDIAPAAVAHARAAYGDGERVRFAVGSCEAVPLASASVDAVVSFETIEHHDLHDAMMLEIKRVLKPEGFLILSSPNRTVYTDRRNYKNPFHVKELDLGELQTLLGNAFERVVIYGQGVLGGSFVAPLAASSDRQFAALGVADDPADDALKAVNWMYFIAVCGPAGVDIALDPSVMLNVADDPHDRLQRDLAGGGAGRQVPEDLRPGPRQVATDLGRDAISVEGKGDFAIVPGALTGFLDVPPQPGAWTGWAVETVSCCPADEVLVVGPTAAYLLRPHVPRPDIARLFGRLGAWLSGYVLPDDLAKDFVVAETQAFALGRGVATRLIINQG